MFEESHMEEIMPVRDKRLPTLMRVRDIKIFVSCISLSVFLYLLPKIPIQPIKGGWGPAIDWGRFHILHAQRVPVHTSANTYIARMTNYGSTDILPKIFLAQINMISGITDFPAGARFLDGLPWVGAILIPILVLCWYRRMSSEDYKLRDALLIFLVALFPHAAVLDNLSGGLNPSIYARGLFAVILYSLSRAYLSKRSSRWMILSVFLSLVMFDFYHTWTYYIFIYLVVAGIVIVLPNMRKRDKFNGAIGLSIIMFIFAAAWLNQNLIVEPARLVITSLVLADPISLFSGGTTRPYQSLTATPNNGLFSAIIIGHSIAIGLIGILFGLWVFTQHWRGKSNPAGDIWMVFGFGQALVGIALIVRSGISALTGRFLQAPTVLVLFLVPYLLTLNNKKITSIVRVLAVCMIIMGTGGYLISPSTPSSMDNQEIQGLRYTGTHTEGIPVFGGFRLATPALYFGKTELYTTHSAYDNPRKLKQILNSTYYSNESPCSQIGDYLEEGEYIVITSEAQSEKPIFDPSKKFKSAPPNFQLDWRNDRNYNSIYSNGVVMLNSRTSGKCIVE